MCVKCGINSCGCSGKTTVDTPSGNVVWDGTAITCATDSSIDIEAGEKLNSILDKILKSICKDSVLPYSFNSQNAVALNAIGLVHTSDPVPETGTYLVRAVIEVSSNVGVGQLTSAQFELKKNGTTGLSLYDGKYFNSTEPTDWKTIVLEGSVALTALNTVSIDCTAYANTGGAAFTKHSLYVQKLG